MSAILKLENNRKICGEYIQKVFLGKIFVVIMDGQDKIAEKMNIDIKQCNVF